MNKEQAIALIDKYNEGKASVEEVRLVENWFAQQSEITQQIPQDLDYLNIKQEMWLKIDPQINHLVKLNPNKRKLGFGIAAAAAVLLIAMTAVFFYVSQKDNVAVSLAKNDVNPGKNKALLTLADGRKISLTDAMNGEVAKQAGVLISKNEKGQLIYQATGGVAGNGQNEFNTIEAPKGGQWQVILPDGSKVFLNALSSLKYPVSFSKRERRVELNGEAYFEISHNKNLPFRVIAKGQTVEVLGTHFNIMAYPDEAVIKTTLFTGSVRVASASESMILKPGEQSQLSGDKLKVVPDVDLEDVMAWKNGYFKFDENLADVMAKVSRWYDVEVNYQLQPDPVFKYKGEISRNKNLSEILNMLEYTGNVHFKIEGRRVIVTK
ncbi:FecR family protein [Pedobacter sp. MC2016-24]|uniref:FecR family protein n=1 Tax=Pedobacter sp. MC2016-24 TaxID=2780090 RepID=UPI00188003F2|nr:FecR family protein [Pedobacter sp. MC2016-24]MBE9598563.1 FecR domain-containing protein [Pedobacter sp. MC2016-24]